MSFDEALSYLLSLGHETLTIKLGLANTEILLGALRSPHQQFPAVQIAGTNGKGSVAVTLEAICRAAGIRTGLFTSPHLVSITERIIIAGEPISESDFARLTAQIKETARKLVAQGILETLPTFFEHITAIALLAFREAKIELAILETGLGGRLDSTTAAGAQIVAITPIAMDHEEYLGHSVAEIATEKAAIIRRGVAAAVVAPQPKEALDAIVRRCQSVEVRPTLIREPEPDESPAEPGRYVPRFRTASADGRFRITLETDHDKYEDVHLGLRGRHQITNAATAIALAEALRERGFAITRAAIVRGIGTATHPGRLELLAGPPQILFDGAHNPSAARSLRDYLDQFVNLPITMIFGAMRDKALGEIAAVLFPAAHNLILAEFDNLRAASGEMMKSAVPDGLDPARVRYASSANEALRVAREVTPTDGLICVTGSLYLVGETRKQFSGKVLESLHAKF